MCGITRLAYYNVNSNNENYFVGLPITCSSIFIPLVFIITKNEIALMSVILLLSIAFVTNIKIKKPSLKIKVLLSVIGIIGVTYLILL